MAANHSAPDNSVVLPMSAVDREQFRLAMRLVAATVTLVTAASNGLRSGLTATAMCSLSDDPPSMLVCVNRTAITHDFIVSSRMFCINILGEQHRELAEIFAGRTGLDGEPRFVHGEWQARTTGAPVLCDSCVSLECQLVDRAEMKTHTVFIGQVLALHMGLHRRPLLYADRNFGRWTALE